MLNETTDTTWIDTLLHQAIAANASDLHIEPKGAYAVLRQRIQGLLKPVKTLSLWQYYQIITRFKVLAHLDIAQHRLPQEGRFSTVYQRHHYDIRLSVFPTLHGEKLALRMIDMRHIQVPLDQLGFTAQQLKQYQSQLHQAQGFILITGPTGSGKTVTLYASLLALNNAALNIVTLEDPVEYTVESFNQTSIRKQTDFDFSQALTALLRQDPDVILVGEIRDIQTAKVALHAAQTGHLVLASLHCNDSIEAVFRLTQLGLDQTILFNTLSVIVAQRLIRTLCQRCKTTPDKKNTCHYCIQGFTHRHALFECLVFDDQLKVSLNNITNQTDINALLRDHCKPSLWEAGMKRVKEGQTTLAELKRVLADE